MILWNPVVLSVVVMSVLCLLKLNVLISILIAALVAGGVAGMGLSGTISTLIGGMGGNAETALSYILLGTLAVAINHTGVASILSRKIASLVKGKKYILLCFIAFIACFSQNLIPVHIAFIPILIPPLLKLMNHLKVDRRAMACALAFGLKTPYVTLPVGFGLIFHGILSKEMSNNGMEIAKTAVYKPLWVLGVAMLIGVLLAIFVTYRNPREYQDLPLKGMQEVVSEKMEAKHWLTLVAAILAFVVQILTGSLPLGALAALIAMFVFRCIKWNEIDEMLNGGVQIMGLIAIIMLVAAGYGTVIRETGAVAELINALIGMVGGSKVVGAFAMLIVGLLITMGIGTSFGTIPVVATIYVPMCIQLGFSVQSTVILLAAAAALGDAGSPASDTTLGPTSGLNADGQHEHIWDTCVPTFLHFNVALIIGAMIGSIMIYG
ncbi:Na+/H+ antiporter family protein [Fusobacterium necrophorum subsp. funduliforme ATCC 51357]|uniref:Sodium:proton antiporter n=2 Tax=Fusobacterium necrophorum TaxID=859 RepID=A0AB73BV37_9FUSO|nr:SLC13 family permease [Fusobacterium necrophorum]AYZ72995.1 sodium:proton antiporter [Fusobacterium necrophorum]AZW09006.1 sodium:proton antiporter [Fusobacterium necrophorum subsp. necrophorum]EIJ69329.1 Na+/H+ antiporter family protein [Fusobacterium necrophorum subsp. funduliforme ATCC 51357]KAB0553219.1 sodium:proton antiporter [Fusobacterium necrophorum subsp. funduliforme]KDE62250.1 sodium:proton antiporter [Fusobacterium necrophorum BL]